MIAAGQVQRIACTAAGLLLSGCGPSGNGVPPIVQGTPEGLNLITPAAVRAVAPRSPQRTVLRWWLDTQYGIAGPALSLFAPAVQRQLGRTAFRNAVYREFGPWSAHARPRVRAVWRTGPYATVDLTLEVRSQLAGSDRTTISREPATFSLVEDHGAWRLADASFFIHQLAMLREQRAEAAREANPG